MLRYQSDSPAVAQPAPTDSVVTVHVGLPKTGTTLLQARFFPVHRQIEYLGKSEPEHAFCTPGVSWLVSETLRRGVFRCDHHACRAVFQREVRPLLERGRTLVLSLEDGSHGSPRRRRAKMENLRAVWGECRLLITLRNPASFIESLYLQRVKKLNLSGKRSLKLPWSLSLQQWLESCESRGEKADLSHLDYADYIADWEAVFGRESIGILLYEQLRRDPDAYFERLCDLLGVARVVAADIVGGEPVNPRLKAHSVEQLRLIKRSAWRSLLFGFSSPAGRERMLGEPTGPDARATLPASWQSRVEQWTRRGNQLLATHWRLPLEEYGYPL